MARHWSWEQILGHVIRPRIVVYTVILVCLCGGLAWGIANKADLRLNVIRDRGVLAREVEDGLIENVYRLQVMNVTEQTHHYVISASGLADLQIEGQTEIEMAPATTKSFTIGVRVPPESAGKGSHKIFFDLRARENPKMSVHEKATFLMP